MRKNGHPTNYRQELRDKILRTAIRLFKQHGVKSVKMDDISNVLAISKRTLYEIYDNKEELLLAGVRLDKMNKRQQMEAFATKGNHNEIEVMAKFVKIQMEDLNNISPLFFSEIGLYKRVVSFLQEHKAEQRRYILDFIQQGVEHGYFMPGLNYDIVIDMGDGVMNHVMETKLYEQYPIQEIFHNYVSVLMRGYCTDKGIQELDKLFKP
jgi:AcrR family transcriptional regulator